MANDLRATLHDASRLETLRETALLDSPPEESFDRLTRLAARVLQAPVAMVSLLDADRHVCKSCLGLPEPWASRRELPLSHSYCQHAITGRDPLLIEDARAHPLVRDSPAIRELRAIAYAGAPLVAPGGQVLGTLCVIDHRPRAWTAPEVETLEDLADAAMAQIALRSAARRERRLGEALGASEELRLRELRERAGAEAEARRAVFLAEASRILSASLEPETTLSSLANLVVPTLADWCIIDVLESEGRHRRARVQHADPRKTQQTRALRELRPPALQGEGTWGEVARTGEAVLVSYVTDEWLEATAPDPGHLRLVRALGIASYLCVPLQVRTRAIGALTLVAGDSGRCYDVDDLALAEELARRAALAIDNARLHAEAQRAIDARDQVLAVVSHDLMNPLNLVSSAARLLLEAKLPEAKRGEQLEVIARSAERMSGLIRDLLEVARIEAGGLSIQPRPLEVAAVMDEVCRAYRPLVAGKSLRWECEVRGEPPPVLGDRDRILQLFSNLVENAVKFTEQGAITVRAEAVEDGVRFAVADTGSGIAEEQRALVFDRYWQARRGAGAGLGLAIARGIVEAHGGRIWVESEPGVGSTFYFVLPTPGSRGSGDVPAGGDAPETA